MPGVQWLGHLEREVQGSAVINWHTLTLPRYLKAIHI